MNSTSDTSQNLQNQGHQTINAENYRQFGVRHFGYFNYLGLWTLYRKEVQRFIKVWMQTFVAPVVTTLLFLAIFSVPSEPIVDGKDSMLLPLYALVAISVSALILISVTLCVVMTVVVKVTRRKKEEQHTYRMTPEREAQIGLHVVERTNCPLTH